MGTLGYSLWDLISRPEIEPGPPALGVWSLSHWTTKEVPTLFYMGKFFMDSTVEGYVLECAQRNIMEVKL